MPTRAISAFLFVGLSLMAMAALGSQAPGKNPGGPKPAASTAPDPAAVARGKKLFDAKCAICHYSTSEAKKIGPGLKELYGRGRYADGTPVDDASLKAWIEKGGKNMPGYKAALSREQIGDLIAYLKSL